MQKIKRARWTAIFSLVLSIVPASLRADATDTWREWQVLLQKSCPKNHVDWACDSCWTQLTGAFEDTLGTSDRQKLSRVRDYHGCEQEKIGLSCEMGASLEAYKRVRLLQRFVSFGCRAVKCEEVALCSRFPNHAP